MVWDSALLVGIIVAASIVFLLILWRFIRVRMNRNRSYDMVFLKVLVPKKESKEDREKEGGQYGGEKDFKEAIGVMTQFFDSIHSVYEEDFKYHIIGQDFFSIE